MVRLLFISVRISLKLTYAMAYSVKLDLGRLVFIYMAILAISSTFSHRKKQSRMARPSPCNNL